MTGTRKFLHVAAVTECIEAAHQLSLPYASKCNSLHGHSYKIIVELSAMTLNEHGMVADFSVVRGCIRRYDHANLNDFFRPSTAETFARWLFLDIEHEMEVLTGGRVSVVKVTVWETAKNKVTVIAVDDDVTA